MRPPPGRRLRYEEDLRLRPGSSLTVAGGWKGEVHPAKVGNSRRDFLQFDPAISGNPTTRLTPLGLTFQKPAERVEAEGDHQYSELHELPGVFRQVLRDEIGRFLEREAVEEGGICDGEDEEEHGERAEVRIPEVMDSVWNP